MKKKVLALALALTIPASAFTALANSDNDETANYDDLVMTIPATEADGTPIYDVENNESDEYKVMLISENGEIGVPYGASAPEKIIIDNENVEIKGKPVVHEGVIMLPLRELVEADGMTVEWDEETNTAMINLGMYAVTLGENAYIKGRMTPIELDCTPVLIDDKTYVPANYFAEVLGKKVEVKDNAVYISKMDIQDENAEDNSGDTSNDTEKAE